MTTGGPCGLVVTCRVSRTTALPGRSRACTPSNRPRRSACPSRSSRASITPPTTAPRSWWTRAVPRPPTSRPLSGTQAGVRGSCRTSWTGRVARAGAWRVRPRACSYASFRNSSARETRWTASPRGRASCAASATARPRWSRLLAASQIGCSRNGSASTSDQPHPRPWSPPQQLRLPQRHPRARARPWPWTRARCCAPPPWCPRSPWAGSTCTRASSCCSVQAPSGLSAWCSTAPRTSAWPSPAGVRCETSSSAGPSPCAMRASSGSTATRRCPGSQWVALMCSRHPQSKLSQQSSAGTRGRRTSSP
mmetsp:Transcript_6942/g.20191  ORF Transcript_6942/g.20191 Transcript_6942/m.20191 type:complete len:307 (-) Transcript_6942:664-1584(-)